MAAADPDCGLSALVRLRLATSMASRSQMGRRLYLALQKRHLALRISYVKFNSSAVRIVANFHHEKDHRTYSTGGCLPAPASGAADETRTAKLSNCQKRRRSSELDGGVFRPSLGGNRERTPRKIRPGIRCWSKVTREPVDRYGVAGSVVSSLRATDAAHRLFAVRERVPGRIWILV
jgi:hypothetical protein